MLTRRFWIVFRLAALLTILWVLRTQVSAQTFTLLQPGSPGSTSLSLLSGESFVLDLSFSVPPGCSEVEFDLVLPTSPRGSNLGTPTFNSPAWSITNFSGNTWTYRGTGLAPGSQNVQLNFSSWQDIVCDNTVIPLSSTLRFRDGGGGSCASDQQTNTVTLTLRAPYQRTVRTLIPSPTPICGATPMFLELELPQLARFGHNQLSNPAVEVELTGTPTVYRVLQDAQSSQPRGVAYTTRLVSGNTVVRFSNPDVWRPNRARYTVIFAYPCGSVPATLTSQAAVVGTDPCTSTPYRYQEPALTLPTDPSCCPTSPVVLASQFGSYARTNSACLDGCGEGWTGATLNHVLSNTTLQDVTATFVLPAGLEATRVLKGASSANATATYTDLGSAANAPISQVIASSGAAVTYPGGVGFVGPLQIEVRYSGVVAPYSGIYSPSVAFKARATASPTETIQVSWSDATNTLSYGAARSVALQACAPVLYGALQFRTPSSGSPVYSGAVRPGDKVQMAYIVSNATGAPVTGINIFNLLPPGFTVCPGTVRFGFTNSLVSVASLAANTLSPDPVTGASPSDAQFPAAHVFTFGPFDLPGTCGQNSALVIAFDLEVDAGTPSGVYPDNFLVSAPGFGTSSSPDQLFVNESYQLEGEVLVDCSLDGNVGRQPLADVELQPGSPVRLVYRLTNTGNIPVRDIRVLSHQAAPGDVEADDCSIARGSTTTLEYLGWQPAVTTSPLGGTITASNLAVSGFGASLPCATSACTPFAAQGAFGGEVAMASLTNTLLPGASVELQLDARTDFAAAPGSIAKQNFSFCAVRADLNVDAQPGRSATGTVLMGGDSCTISTPYQCPQDDWQPVNVPGAQGCCFNLVIAPQGPKGPDSIVLQAGPGVQFTQWQLLDPNFTLTQGSSTSIAFEQVNFYSANTTAIQVCATPDITGNIAIGVDYHCTAQNVVCDDRIDLRCSYGLPPDPCVEATQRRIYCDPGDHQYYVEFCVDIDPAASLGKIDLVANQAIRSGPTPPGWLPLPTGPQSLAYTHTGGTLPTGTTCTFKLQLPGALPGSNVQFQLTGIGPGGRVACPDTLFSTTLVVPPPCDTSCAGLLSSRLDNRTGFAAGVRKLSLELDNRYTPRLDRLELVPAPTDALLANRAYAPLTGFVLGNGDGVISAGSGQLPVGTNIITDIDLAAPANGPLIVRYMLGDLERCRDTLPLPTAPLVCAPGLNVTFDCDAATGLHTLTLNVSNNGTATLGAFDLALVGTPWSTRELLGSPMAPGDTRTLVYPLPSGTLSSAGGQACLDVTAIEFDTATGTLGALCSQTTLCSEYPPCGSPGCTCGTWDFFDVVDHKNVRSAVACNDRLSYPCSGDIRLEGEFQCSPADVCSAYGYTIAVTPPFGAVQSYTVAGPTLSFPLAFRQNGTYRVDITVDCNGTPCVCTLFFTRNCSDCQTFNGTSVSLADVQPRLFASEPPYLATGIVADEDGRLNRVRSFLAFDLSDIPANAQLTRLNLQLDASTAETGYGAQSSQPEEGTASNDYIVYPVNLGADSSLEDLDWAAQPEALYSPDTLVQGGLWVSGPRYGVGLGRLDLSCMLDEAIALPRLALGMRLFDETPDQERVASYASHYAPNAAHHPQLEVCYDLSSAVVEASVGSLRVFPNPVRELLHLELPSGSEAMRVQVVDGAGRQVLEVADGQQAIDVTALPAGVYTVRVQTKTGVYASPFVRLQR